MDHFSKFLNKVKLFQYLKKKTNRTATVTYLSRKIIEKLVHRQLYEFIEFSNLLYANQFGFHNLYSANHALITITEKKSEKLLIMEKLHVVYL